MELTELPLPPAIWVATPGAAQTLIVAQRERIRELEARLGQDSSNFSCPPSSDLPQAPARLGKRGPAEHLMLLARQTASAMGARTYETSVRAAVVRVTVQRVETLVLRAVNFSAKWHPTSALARHAGRAGSLISLRPVYREQARWQLRRRSMLVPDTEAPRARAALAG
jgi:Family of unknown function (DUF6444)